MEKKTKAKLPLSPIYRIMKKAGIKGKIGKQAVMLMRDKVEEYIMSETGKAAMLMQHADRKTLMKEDFEMLESSYTTPCFYLLKRTQEGLQIVKIDELQHELQKGQERKA